MYIYIYIIYDSIHMYAYINIHCMLRRTARGNRRAPARPGDREFTKGGLVNGGLAIRYVFNLHVSKGT